MIDPETALETMGGIARGSALRGLGVARGAIARAVTSGAVIRVRAGVFAVPATPPDVVQAAEHGGSLTCGPALRLQGIWSLGDAAPHVWLGTSGRRHHGDCGCVGHYFDGPTRFGTADIETALVHLLACAGDEAFFAAYESALHQRRLGAAARERIRRAVPASSRWLLDLARGDAESGLESLLRLRLHLMGLSLQTQVVIAGVGRVDFVLAGRIILEVDGKENHEGSRRHQDLMRDAEASRLGYESLRFDYAMVLYEWPVVAAAILSALDRLRARV